MQKKCVNLLLLSTLLFSGCTVVLKPEPNEGTKNKNKPGSTTQFIQTSSGHTLELAGQWLTPLDDKTPFYIDPQPSGLTGYNNTLVSISDASANQGQIKRLHFIDPATSVVSQSKPYSIAPHLADSCFTQYLQTKPDLEALVKDPFLPNTFITVTEDASTLGILTPDCQAKFSQTHSTRYPTVLVRLQLTPNDVAFGIEVLAGAKLEITGVRAVQFPRASEVGDFANDGIEGLALIGTRLFLGLEKNTHNQARVFSTPLSENFWETEDFIAVEDTNIDYPNYATHRPNPINGMDTFTWKNQDWLVAAARNDNELWLVNVADIDDKYKVKLRFTAPNFGKNCPASSLMDNASLEGVAVVDGIVYLVNDPWKKNYHKNIVCEEMRIFYDNAAPLMFSLSIDELWQTAQKM